MKKPSLLLLLTTVLTLSTVVNVNDTGKSGVIGSHKPVKVVAGDDAVLPCHLEPRRSATKLGVWWKRSETKVHVYRNRADDPELQDENFKGRTSLFHHEMEKGNISLKLRNVTERDAGTYTCFIPKLESQVKKDTVTLIVVPVEENTTRNPIPPGPEPDPWRKGRVDAGTGTHPDPDPDPDPGNNIPIGYVVGILVVLAGLVVLVIIGYKKRERIKKAKCDRRGQRNEEDHPSDNPEAVRLRMSN